MTAVKKGVILILTVSIFMFLLEGCGGGVDYKSPEAIVKSLVRSYQDQNEQAVTAYLKMRKFRRIYKRK